MSAKSKARAQLGSEDKYIDLDGLNEERRIAKTTYNTNKNKLMTDYNDQISGLNADRADNRRAFDTGRHTIGTQAYFANKTNEIKDRNLGGLSQLRRLGTEMAVDRANSDVANTYYNNAEALDLREKGYTNDYNSGLEAIKNALDSSLASIKSRENTLRNEYRAKVATLAEQIQARLDATAQANASLQLMRDELEANKNIDIYNKISNIFNNGDLSLAEKIKQASMLYTNLTGNKNGEGYLYNKGFINKSEYAPYITSPVTPGNATKDKYSTMYYKQQLNENAPIPFGQKGTKKSSKLIPSPLLDDRRG